MLTFGSDLEHVLDILEIVSLPADKQQVVINDLNDYKISNDTTTSALIY